VFAPSQQRVEIGDGERQSFIELHDWYPADRRGGERDVRLAVANEMSAGAGRY